jgi:hypothetical protein
MNKKYELKNCEGHVLLVASQILLGSLLLVNHLVYKFLNSKVSYVNILNRGYFTSDNELDRIGNATHNTFSTLTWIHNFI